MLLYIIQANIAIALFSIIYKYLLSSDTLFGMRRASLLIIVIASLSFQLLPAIANINLNQPTLDFTATDQLALTQTAQEITPNTTQSISLYSIALYIYLAGAALLTIRLICGFIAITQLHARGKKIVINNTNIIITTKSLTPFSFYKWVFLSPSQLYDNNLEDVLTHEKSHIKGLHIIDVITSEFLVALLWFNPAAWYIRYAIRENLEFLADRDVIDCGHNRKEYQYNLLKLSYTPSVNQLVNYFNVSQLKNRIIMMNKEKTSKKAVLKYLLLVPTLMLLSLTNNAQTKEVKSKTTKEVRSENIKDIIINGHKINPLILIDGKESSKSALDALKPEEVGSITVLKDKTSLDIYGEKGQNGVILINTKAAENRSKPEDIDLKVVGSIGKIKDDIKVIGHVPTKPIDIEIVHGSAASRVRTQIDAEKVLYIMDNKEVTYAKVKETNTDQIESFSVLKNEKATKIYGDKAENGVIIITLKKQ